MALDTFHALQAARRPGLRPAAPAALLVAGATGVLGNEVLRRLVGQQRHGTAQVLAREPMQSGLHGVQALLVADQPIDAWPAVAAGTGVVMFEPPRLYYQRERALWTPQPGQLPALAAWMRRCGVRTLAVVQPHAQGRLPEALKRGLASLDEQAVAALGFERVLLLRSAQKPGPVVHAGWPQRLAAWMLSVGRFMLPGSEQPVRAAKIAELVAEALAHAPAGIHVAAPELVWRAAQGDLAGVVAEWLGRHPAAATG